jgi:hypothetical protein
MRKLKVDMKIFGRAKRKDNKMKWVWYNIYENNSRKYEILLDKDKDKWYTKLWQKVKNFLGL